MFLGTTAHRIESSKKMLWFRGATRRSNPKRPSLECSSLNLVKPNDRLVRVS